MPGSDKIETTSLVLDVPASEQEAQALIEFKALTRDLAVPKGSDDYFYLKWLRARELNLTKARQMLEAYLEWKKTCKPNIIDWVPPQLILDEGVCAITGHDNDGRPVACVLLGRLNFRLILETGLKAELTQYIIQFLEKLSNAVDVSRKTNGGITQVVVAVDMEGITLRKIMDSEFIRFALTCVKVLEAYHPELLHQLFVINANWVFMMLFNIVKPFFSANTLGKIQIFKGDLTAWRPALLSNIQAKSLPEEFGGRRGSIYEI